MTGLPEQIDLMRKDKTGKWYPIGTGTRTKTGTGFKCTIFPGQKILGEFFIFPKRAGTRKEKLPEYKAFADEYDPLQPQQTAFKRASSQSK